MIFIKISYDDQSKADKEDVNAALLALKDSGIFDFERDIKKGRRREKYQSVIIKKRLKN